MGLIAYPTRASEFEIQAYACRELRRLGHDVRGEVHGFHGTPPMPYRLDLVLFRNRIAIRIFEVKRRRLAERRKKDSIGDWQREQQIRKYRGLGVPVDMIVGMPEAKELVRRVTKSADLIYSRFPIDWSEYLEGASVVGHSRTTRVVPL